MPLPPTNPLHLYRSLLRESTYFFDTNARSIIPKYVRASFNAHKSVEDSSRLNSYLKRGRLTHSLFIKANVGDPKAAIKILRWAYGRTGKRARELLKPLLTMELEEPLIPNEPKTRQPKILPELRALAVVQQGRVRRITPKIPETNIYGKPFSKRRESNMRWKTYNEAITKLLPPISEEEFPRLEKLVTGDLDQAVPKRRKRPKGEESLDAGEVRRKMVLEKADCHNITKQYRRRLYTQILAEAPRLLFIKNENDGENLKQGMGDYAEIDKDEDEDEERKKGKWIAQFSQLSRGKKPVVGLSEEFEDGDSQVSLVGRKRKEKMKAEV